MVRRLFGLRADFTAGQQKVELIQRILARPPRRLADVTRLHDTLLFLCAFPDSPAVRRAATAACGRFHRIANAFTGARYRAEDTGMVGTITRDACVFPIAEWLHRAFAGEVDIDWREIGDTTTIDALLRPVLQRAEEDAFDSGELSTREWFALRGGASGETDLGLLLRGTPAGTRARKSFAAMYDAAAVPLRWRIGNSAGAATHNVLATARPVHRRSMRPAPPDPVRFIASATRAIELLSPRRAARVIHVARAALASRGREVHAMTYANPSEVYLADLGEGASLAVFGVVPEYRMSLEANYGYLMLSNGVPIGYGGVTPLFRQANTGLNIFPSFRGGEAAYLWAATLRAFQSLFGVRRFVVNGYQVGHGNREAIKSGAFWFYYRLGFRPADPGVRALARREYAHIRVRETRSGASTLQKLADGDLWLDLPGYRRRDYFDEAWLIESSRRATAALTDEGRLAQDGAAGAISTRLAHGLRARQMASWPAAEQRAFQRLAPVCALLPAMARWSAASRTAVVRLMRAKGLPQEREFVLLARRDPRFFPGLIRLYRRSN